jgi:hypothetical protein
MTPMTLSQADTLPIDFGDHPDYQRSGAFTRLAHSWLPSPADSEHPELLDTRINKLANVGRMHPACDHRNPVPDESVRQRLA